MLMPLEGVAARALIAGPPPLSRAAYATGPADLVGQDSEDHFGQLGFGHIGIQCLDPNVDRALHRTQLDVEVHVGLALEHGLEWLGRGLARHVVDSDVRHWL